MLCEDRAILQETLKTMELDDLHIRQIGERAIVAPAYQLQAIREALEENGTYPKVIGDIKPPEAAFDQEEEEQEEASDEEGESADDDDETSDDSQDDEQDDE
jgi:hypothetical protein